jgi:hypothetical protein
LSNFSYEKKRDRVTKENVYVGYKNGLFLNEDLKNEDEWTEDKIIKRGKN